MALKSTIYKARLHIADLDRHYYHDHHLTIAKHPSETDERMMLRILVFALHAHKDLQFTKGLSTDNEPDLWQKNFNGDIKIWIELGQPDEKRIRKACGLSQQVIVYCYSGSSAELWWKQNHARLQRFQNLAVYKLSADAGKELAGLMQRSMQLHCNIQDGNCWLGDGETNVEVKPIHLE
ncbi:YaeQ family protein [Kaarinaea lacus]